jgi:hypothetical protein
MKFATKIYLHEILVLKGPLVIMADHQGPYLILVFWMYPKQATTLGSITPLVQAKTKC